jgi:hypothetical protein
VPVSTLDSPRALALQCQRLGYHSLWSPRAPRRVICSRGARTRRVAACWTASRRTTLCWIFRSRAYSQQAMRTHSGLLLPPPRREAFRTKRTCSAAWVPMKSATSYPIGVLPRLSKSRSPVPSSSGTYARCISSTSPA